MDKWELCVKVRDGKQASAELLESVKPLCVKIARRYWRPEQCSSMDDLIQECHRAVLDAATHWKPEKGAFGTCLDMWCKKRILDFLRKARQMGAQLESAGEVPADPENQRDYSHLWDKIDCIEELYSKNLISYQDLEIMRVVVSPLEEFEENTKPLFATWWQKAKRATLNKVAAAMRVLQGSPQRVEVQQEMWA